MRPSNLMFYRMLVSGLLMIHLTGCQAQPESSPMTNLSTPTKFNPKRTEFQCVRWHEPAIDQNSSAERWYKAATTLQAEGAYKQTVDYLRMLYLYEGAARQGHWKAINNLIMLYSEGGYSTDRHFPIEIHKARYWIQQGVQNGWAIADSWLGYAYSEGKAGYEANPELGLAYIQRAADAGVPVAQFGLAELYSNEPIANLKIEEQFLRCAAGQGLSAAGHELAIALDVRGKKGEALSFYQNAIMNGGERGGGAAVSLNRAFLGEIDVGVVIDPIRAKAYRELDEALLGTNDTRGNPFLKFPRLNEVLPLPPAKMPPWEGIYSAMSPEDAAYYQNPPKANELIKEVIDAKLFPEGYITKPEPIKFGTVSDESLLSANFAPQPQSDHTLKPMAQTSEILFAAKLAVGGFCPATGFWTTDVYGGAQGIFLRKGDKMPGHSFSKAEQEAMVWRLVKLVDVSQG